MRGNDERLEATSWDDLMVKASEMLDRAARFAADASAKKPETGKDKK